MPPTEAPRNGAKVFDALRGFARRRPRANIERSNLSQWCGFKKIIGETRRLVNQMPVSLEAVVRQHLGRLNEGSWSGFLGLQQTGLQGGGYQGFQIAPPQSRVGIFGVDHFALLGEPDLPTHRAGGLRKNGVIAGAAAAPHGTAAAMKQTQSDAVFFFQGLEHTHQGQLGLVKRPVAGEDAAVFVAVRVPQHDVLFAAAAFHHGRNAWQGVIVAHDVRRLLQVFNRFKQGRDNQFSRDLVVQGAVQQACFFLQHQHFQQIAHAFGVADDGVANGV